MREMSKTWIDMTDLSAWKGHMTGIQRVVYNTAVHYAESNDVGYFVFDERTEKFYDYDFLSLAERIELEAQRTTPEAQQGSRAKKIFHAVRARTPKSLRSKINPKWQHRAKNAYLKSRTLYTSTRQRINIRHRTERSQVIFAKDDKVLILGNSWDKPTIISALRKAKERTGFRIFQVVYDLIPIYEPQSFNQKLYEKYTNHMYEVASISDGLMAISESTKKDLLRFCDDIKLPAPEINVIRLGDEIEASSTPTRPSDVPNNTEFILCVGTIEARKNHALLYYTWKRAREQGTTLPKLVIVGRTGWFTKDILHYIELDSVTRNDFIILQNANDSQLTWLYQNCLFTIYPSTYEGWGLPIAESLAYGKVCVASNASSMTEIAGNLLDYFSPFSADECLALITKYMNKTERNRKEKTIKTGYKITSWKETYQQIKSAL